MNVNSKDYLNKKIEWLISEAVRIEEIPLQNSQELVSKIEEFFKKSIEVCIDLHKKGFFCRDDLMQAFKRIETLAEKQNLQENRSVKMFRKIVKRENFDLNSLPVNNQSTVSEFLDNQDLLTFRELEPFREFGDEYFLSKINEGTPVIEFGFPEQLLMLFLKKHGKSIKTLNLDGFMVADPAIFNENLQELESLSICGNEIGVREAEAIGTLQKLKELIACDCGLTDEGIAFIGELSNLESLDITDNPIGDRGAEALQNLKELKALQARSCGLTGEGMAFIGELSTLESLDITDNPIGDRGAEPLQNLKKLRMLGVEVCDLTCDGMVFIGKLLNLERLEVLRNSIGNKGVACLQNLKNLRELLANNCGITDFKEALIGELVNLEALDLGHIPKEASGAEAFQNLEKLRELRLNDKSISGVEITHFKESLLQGDNWWVVFKKIYDANVLNQSWR